MERRLARPWGGIRACALKVLTRYVIKCIFGGGVVVVVDQGLLHSHPLHSLPRCIAYLDEPYGYSGTAHADIYSD